MKDAKPNIAKNERPKVRTKIDSEMFYCFKQIPITQATIDHWVKELNERPQTHPEEDTITEFLVEKEIARVTYYAMLKKFPDLKYAHELYLQRIGERHLREARKGKANWQATHWNLHNYSPEFDANNQYHAKLKKDSGSQVTGIRLVEIRD